MKEGIPKIGILINDIEGRYQNLILSGLRQYAFEEKCQFYFFVGKSLESPYKDETAYNAIYHLANTTQIDGLIVTAGAIGNYLNEDQSKEFLKTFSPKPVITIGNVVDSVPGIFSDGKKGLRELVKHFVRDHQFQKIAYISGSVSNPEGASRLRIFIEEMKANNRAVDKEFIFPGDFSFQSGNTLAEKLISGKSLKCDAILCANDEMALGAMDKLKARGFEAPKDYAIAGFDDISDAHFTTPPLTTITHFLPKQAYIACKNIIKMINNQSIPSVICEESSLVLRESCGCGGTGFIKKPKPLTHEGIKPLSSLNIRDIIDSILSNSHLPDHLISEIRNAVSALLENLILDVRLNRTSPLFLLALNDWLNLTLHWENFTELWHSVLQSCHNELISLPENDKDLNYIHLLFQQAYASIALHTAQKEAGNSNRLKWLMIMFNSISARLNFHSNLHEALESVSEYFLSLGIEDFHIVLEEKKDLMFFSTYRDQEKTEDNSTPLPDDAAFVSKPLSSNNIFSFHHKTNMLLPLTFHDQYFGYICLSGKQIDPLQCTALRSTLSQTLFSLTLLEQNKERDRNLHKTMETLRQSETRFKEMASVNPMFILETTLQLKITYLNRLSEIFFEENNPPANLSEILPDPDKIEIEKIIRRLKIREEITPYPGIRIIGKTRNLIPIAQIVGIYRENSNELTGLRFFAFDPIPFIRKTILPSDDFFRSNKISPREQDVIKLVLQGMSIRNIGENLFISESTVKGHLTQIYSKFGISGKNEMVRLIQEHQVKTHGYSEYLFTVLNHLLTIDNST